MMLRSRNPLVLASVFLAAVVFEKLTILHLPPDWLRVPLHWFGGAPAGFGLALLFFGWRKLAAVSWRAHVSWTALAAHLALFGSLIGLQLWFHHSVGSGLSHGTFQIMASVWTLLIPLIVLTLILNFVSVRSLWHLVRSLRSAWLYAAGVTTVVLLFRYAEDTAWSTHPSGLVGLVQEVCFRQTADLLHLLYPVVISYQPDHVLGTPRFIVTISWLCSGIEGLLLVTVLIALWIVFLRKELIVRRALLIAPIALLLTWFANILRLAVLIAIGDHGHATIADVGFHAQAGWVSLNLIALGALFLVQRHPWFRKDGWSAAAQTDAESTNYAVVYLLPFTLIIAASMLTQAVSDGFEALYALRLVVALGALWLLRAHYRRMNWRFGPSAVLAGAAVGAVWALLAMRLRPAGADALMTNHALEAMTRLHRQLWIASRVAAAVVTVPIAEELAFRGFAARRLMRSDFEHQPYRSMNWVSLLVSSVVFGAMHGHMWAAGIATGAVFWALARMTNRLGDAVAAHAVANGLIAAVGLHLHDYTMW